MGSTTIPHIRAKPIIDIAIESEAFPPHQAMLEALECLGYVNRGEAGVSGRLWFVKGMSRKFNLHWCPGDGSVARSQVAFRDELRRNRELACEYEPLKVEAAPRETVDSEQYAEAKA